MCCATIRARCEEKQPVEGAFLACTLWLADAYVLAGELDKAQELFDRVAAIANDLGLFAEEYDTGARRQTGNFPQALTHIALINTAHNPQRGEEIHREAGDAAVEIAIDFLFVIPGRASLARTRNPSGGRVIVKWIPGSALRAARNDACMGARDANCWKRSRRKFARAGIRFRRRRLGLVKPASMGGTAVGHRLGLADEQPSIESLFAGRRL